MILRKVTLDNWRALSHFEMKLEPGVNVLQGPNEAGKSSIVEALDWALYRDITGARLNLDDIRAIIPATDPSSRPSVQVEIEFADCTAVVTKTLAEDSGKRECRLTLRRSGAADEYFDRTEAQRRLRALFASDGLGAEKGSLAQADLLISHQGETQDFLSDGSTAIRSTLGVATDGNLALTTRLERVRLGVEQNRRKELMQDLVDSALEAARANTEAARIREALHEAMRQVAHFEAVEREIEALRDEIQETDAQVADVAKSELEARERVEQQNRLIVEQAEADKVVLQAEGQLREAESKREAAATRNREVEHLRAAQAADEKALEASSNALSEAQENLAAAQQTLDSAQSACEQADTESEELKRLAQAWQCYSNVFDTREARRNEERGLQRLQALGQSLEEAEKRKQQAPAAPSWNDLRSWRQGWEELRRLEAEASQSLQIQIEPEADIDVKFTADNVPSEAIHLSYGTSSFLNAMVHGTLEIPGFGRIQLRSGARGAEETKAAVEAARQKLSVMLEAWAVHLDQLEGQLAEFESRRTELDEIERAWQAAVDALKAEEAHSGSLKDAETRVQLRQGEFEAARVACEPFSGLIELGGKSRSEVKAAQDAAERASRESTSRATRARNEVAAMLQKLRVAESTWNEVSKRPDALKAAMQGRAEQLERLENDGLSPEQRAAHLDHLTLALVQARQVRDAAVAKRGELGNSVSQWNLDEARRQHGQVAEQRSVLEKRLVELRRDLFHHCEVDAVAELERWRAEAEKLEAEGASHEARLRGIAILDAALQLERSRLGRELAGPLNEKLSPWLTSLRGKETAIEFDDSGSKIESVRTKDGESTYSLPYSEHSEGMKEQTAFVLRLLLASRVAKHLPSGRLPVILDDPFTQTDLSRRIGLGTVLKEAAVTLQIIFVTCHEDHFSAEVPANWIAVGEFTPAAKLGLKKKILKAPAKETARNGSPAEVGTLPLW